MRVLVVGAGGLGAVIAGCLAQAGIDVTIFVRPAYAAALESHEVRIDGLRQFVAPVRIATAEGRLGSFDYLLLCVKSRDTEPALAPLRRIEVETVLSLQNGVAKDETLADCFGRGRVLGAVSGVGGTLERPGQARFTLPGATFVGELDGTRSSRGARLAAMFMSAGLVAESVIDILPRTWHKLALFLPSALVSSLTRLDAASALLDTNLARVRAQLARELATVARTEGHPIDHLPVWFETSTSDGQCSRMATLGDSEDEIAAEYVRQGGLLRSRGIVVYPSMAQDVMAGRPTELDQTAGDLLRRAARLGIAVPVHQTCERLLRGSGVS